MGYINQTMYEWCIENTRLGNKILDCYVGDLDLKNIGKSTRKKLKFKCDKCNNIFEIDGDHLTRGQWCGKCNSNDVDSIPLDSPRRLMISRPDLAEEYADVNNIDLKNILMGTNKKVWWRCKECGNMWEAYVQNRTKMNSGCPKCHVGNHGSLMEYMIYLAIKDNYSNTEYQFKVNNMSFDIGIPELKTVIEYQGRYYHTNMYNTYDVEGRDNKKKEFMNKFENIKFITINETYGGDKIRTSNIDIYFNGDNIVNNRVTVVRDIIKEINKILQIDIKVRDDLEEYAISQMHIKDTNDSLGEKYIELTKEWNKSKNGELTPFKIKPKSNKKVWWLCSKCGYEWRTSPAHRVTDETGCPRCVVLNGKSGGTHMVVAGVNDLKTLKPLIAEEWMEDKNRELGLELNNIAVQSNREVWWKCSECGKEYKQKVMMRTNRNKGCPICDI